jgi:hypothetical protein
MYLFWKSEKQPPNQKTQHLKTQKQIYVVKIAKKTIVFYNDLYLNLLHTLLAS